MEKCYFISQLRDLKKFTSYSLEDHKVALCLIENRFQRNDLIIRESIRNILLDLDLKYSFLLTNFFSFTKYFYKSVYEI